jgi:sugar phosphate permease
MSDSAITEPTQIAAAPPAAGVKSAAYRWVMVFVLLLAVTTAFFDRINIAVLFTNADFKHAIGVGNNPAMLGLLMTGFVVAYGVSALILSFTSDVFGPRRTLSIIALLLGVIMAIMGGAASYAMMLVGRVLIGLTEGPQFGSANVAVKQWFPPNERGLASAIWGIGAPLGSMIGFPLVIILVANYGWRASFYVLAALNILVVLPAVWFLVRDKSQATKAVVSGAEAMPFGEAIRLLVSNKLFWLLALYDCSAMVYLWGLNSWLPTYLQVARHFDIKHSSVFSSLPFLLMIGGYFLGGWLGDKWRIKAWLCMVGMIGAGLLVYAASIVASPTNSALLIALSAGSWGLTVPTLFAMGTEVIPPKVTAMGFGIYAGIANIFGALTPVLMGMVIGKSGNYAGGLLVITFACVILSFTMIPLLRRH